jgi:hypothetical protein
VRRLQKGTHHVIAPLVENPRIHGLSPVDYGEKILQSGGDLCVLHLSDTELHSILHGILSSGKREKLMPKVVVLNEVKFNRLILTLILSYTSLIKVPLT